MLPEDGSDHSLAHAAVVDRGTNLGEVLAVGSIVLGVILLVRGTGIWFSDAFVWPLLLAGVGLAVIWRQAGDDDRASLLRVGDRLRRTDMTPDLRTRRASLARVALGVLLVVSGVGAFLAASDAFSAVRQGVLASAGIVGGLALITGPFWVRMGRDLATERRQRIRSEERADMAAHLHDSVLQTLALIQRNADDPRAVVTMARRQERELRGWLFENELDQPGAETPGRGAVAGRRRGRGRCTGSPSTWWRWATCPLDDRLDALVAAAREAMVNAAKWSGDQNVSVYAEVRDGEASVFVRDWGAGFDLDAVAPDRHGVRESIIERMARHGGKAAVRTSPGEGTEVRAADMSRGRRCSWSTTTSCSAPACGPSWATPSRSSARRRRSTPPSR